MAKSSEGYRLTTRLDPDSHLAEVWEDWERNFNTEADAVRVALRRELLDEDDEDDAPSQLHQVTARGVGALLFMVLVLVIGGSIVAFGPVIGGLLTGLAVCAMILGWQFPFERVL